MPGKISFPTHAYMVHAVRLDSARRFMARKVARDMTVEEFDAWCAARTQVAAIAESADEEGGPRLSLVPLPDQQDAWPTDLLAPPVEKGAAAPASDDFAPGQLPVPATPIPATP